MTWWYLVIFRMRVAKSILHINFNLLVSDYNDWNRILALEKVCLLLLTKTYR
jgi:hypothetical protein